LALSGKGGPMAYRQEKGLLSNIKKPHSSTKKRGFPKLFMVVFVGALLAVMVFAVFSKGKVTASVTIGETLSHVSLNDLTGKSVAIPADVKGKVVFLHFWVSSCSYCVKEMCTIESFYKKHYAEGVIAYSINAGEDKQSATRYIANLKINYPILLDPDLSVTRHYGVLGVPTTYVLDRNGVLRFKILGEITADTLDNVARTLL
jgi:cytochrome c biogenesis protein CcmG, thiol:disulfide interchange protein DsbE